MLSPDIISYNSVIEALGAVGRAADALALLPVLRCADLQATVATLESLLYIAFRAGMMSEAVTMWRDITRCGMRASALSFNKFLTALISLVRICQYHAFLVLTFCGKPLRAAGASNDHRLLASV